MKDNKLIRFRYDSKITEAFLNDIRRYDVMTPEEEVEIFIKYQNAASEEEKINIRNEIISHNIRFIYSICKTYRNGNDSLDLISVATEGMNDAIESFDVTKGFKFISYAIRVMHYRIRFYLATNDNVRKPKTSNTTRIGVFRNTFFLENGRYPTKEEIVDYFKSNGIKLTNIAELDVISYSSIDSTNGSSDGETPYAEYDTEYNITTASYNDYEEKIENDAKKQYLAKLISKLEEREKKIIMYTYGMVDGIEYSNETIGKFLGLSGERVRQIRKDALRKLKYISKAI